MHTDHPRRAAALLALCVVPGVAVPVAAGAHDRRAASAASRSARVTLKDISFKPSRVVIARGGRVTWTWRDPQVPHNVTSIGRRFKSSTTKQKGTYSVRFAQSGTFRYHCTIHPGMNGSVVVR